MNGEPTGGTPDWKRLTIAAGAMEDLSAFVQLAALGMEKLDVESALAEMDEARQAVEENLRRQGKQPTPVSGSMLERSKILLRAFARGEIAEGHPYLYRFAIVRTWSIVDEYVNATVADLARSLIVSGDPKWLERLKKVKVPAARFWASTEDERADLFVKQLLVEREVGGKQGMGKFESVLEVFDLNEKAPAEIQLALLALCESRNCIVHNSGCASRNLVDRCPWISSKYGEPLRIKWGQYLTYSDAASWYLFDIARRLMTKHPQGLSTDATGSEAVQMSEMIAAYLQGVREGLYCAGATVPGYDPDGRSSSSSSRPK